jgi:hypothetical protein
MIYTLRKRVTSDNIFVLLDTKATARILLAFTKYLRALWLRLDSLMTAF